MSAVLASRGEASKQKVRAEAGPVRSEPPTNLRSGVPRRNGGNRQESEGSTAALRLAVHRYRAKAGWVQVPIPPSFFPALYAFLGSPPGSAATMLCLYGKAVSLLCFSRIC